MIGKILLRSLVMVSIVGDAGSPAANYVVTGSGIRVQDTSGDETVEFCKRFRLSSEDVRQYFNLARRASEREYYHDLEMSQCRMIGYVKYPNSRGISRWSVDMERRGLITDAAGRSIYYYCKRCTNKAFEDVYDPGMD